MNRKFPIPNNETDRLKALKEYDILDTLSEEEYDSITQIASQIFDTEIALVSLLDENRQWFKSKIGLEVSETPRNISFCQYAIMNDDVLVVEDASEHDVFKENPLVLGDPNIRFYAGAPLKDPNGYNLGTLCVIDSKPKKLTDTQTRLLKSLAKTIISLLTLRKQKREIEKRKEELKTIFSSLNDGVVYQNINGEIIRSNEKAEEILGLSKDQMMGRTSVDPLWNSIHQDGSPFPGDTHPAMITLKTGKAQENVIMGVHKPSGDLTWINITSTPIYLKNDEKQEISGVVTVFSDITKQKKIADVLKKNQDLLISSQEIAKIGSWEFDLQTQNLSWSSQHYKIFGIPEPQKSEVLYQLYRSKIHPEDIIILDEKIQISIETDCSFEFEHRIIDTNGKVIKTVLGIGEVVKNEKGIPIILKGTVQDITERKKTEEIIRETEERWKFAIENVGDGIWDFKPKEGVGYQSDQFFKNIGYEKDEFTVNHEMMLSLIHPDDRNLVDDSFVKHIKGEIPMFDCEYRIKAKDGSYRWILDRAKVVERNEKGESLRMIGVQTNLTDRKNQEDDLRKKEEWIRSLITGMDELIFVLDKDFYFKDFFQNEKEEKLWLSPRFFIGKNITEIGFPQDVVDKIHAAVLSIVKNKTNQKIQYSLDIQSNKKWYDTSISIVFSNDGHEISDIICVARDITHQKKVQDEIIKVKNELQNFFHLSSDFMCVANVDGTFKMINSTFKHVLGYPENELINHPFVNFIHPEDIEKTIKEVEKLALGSLTVDFENRWRKKNGAFIWLSWRAAPDLETGMLYATARDITTQKEVQNELLKAKELAEQTSIAKSDFLANMSHEIRTPLNGVIGFVDLLLESNLNDVQEKYAEYLKKSSKSLLDVINDILDYSKIEAGKIEVEKTEIYLKDFCSEVLDVIAYQIYSKNVELFLEIDSNLPSHIFTDRIRLKQILVNLLGNAAKFTSMGSVALKLDLVKKLDENKIYFSVIDTGIGIPQNKQQKIFDAFSQADTSTTREFGGTGLGLTISNKLLKLIGGDKLELKSKEGKGTVFYFEIPLEGDILKHEKDEFQDLNSIAIFLKEKKYHNLFSKFFERKIKLTFYYNVDDLKNLITSEFDLIIVEHIPDLLKFFSANDVKNRLDFEKIILLMNPTFNSDLFEKYNRIGIKNHYLKPFYPNRFKNLLLELNNLEEKRNNNLNNIISLEKHRVLIVEDYHLNQILLKAMLQKLLPNATFDWAENGKEAIEYFENNNYFVIFMDLQMPIMDGYEATQIIKKIGKGIVTPIISLSAGNVRQDIEGVKFEENLSKPINQNELENIIKKLIKKI